MASPFPAVKDTQCPFCQKINTVKSGTAGMVKCGKCGKSYMVCAPEARRNI